MSVRTYLLIGIAIGVLIFLIGMVIGEDIADWAVEQQQRAHAGGHRVLEMVVFKPIELVFSPERRPYGAIISGAAWPVVLLWPIPTIIGLVIIPGAEAIQDTERQLYFMRMLL